MTGKLSRLIDDLECLERESCKRRWRKVSIWVCHWMRFASDVSKALLLDDESWSLEWHLAALLIFCIYKIGNIRHPLRGTMRIWIFCLVVAAGCCSRCCCCCRRCCACICLPFLFHNFIFVFFLLFLFLFFFLLFVFFYTKIRNFNQYLFTQRLVAYLRCLSSLVVWNCCALPRRSLLWTVLVVHASPLSVDRRQE